MPDSPEQREHDRWLILHRTDWGHEHDSLIPVGAPVSAEDDQLKVIAVVPEAPLLEEVERLRARVAELEAERDRARAEREEMGDLRARLAFIDDDGSPVLMAWVDAHRHHADEPYIGCLFCRDEFVPVAERERAERAEARAGSLEEALREARNAIHRLCLERESTEGYAGVFESVNAALAAPRKDGDVDA